MDHVFITSHSSWREEFLHGFVFSSKGLASLMKLQRNSSPPPYVIPFVHPFAVLLPCTVAESFVTNLILQEVKYKFLLHLETVLEKANPMPFVFFRLSQHRPCSAGNLCSHCFPLS